MNTIEQTHLNFETAVNLGSFYTPQRLVDVVYDLIHKNVDDFDSYTMLDTSCGYGSFLRGKNTVGGDIDAIALKKAAENNKNSKLFNSNGLFEVGREKYKINASEKIIIVGNPPYNDTTSLIRHEIKHDSCIVDKDLKTRDLGLSFLLSYNVLQADYVCVLHPLSYLIKKTNFKKLKPFADNYRLKDCVVVSSGEFLQASKKTQFPIGIALYKRVASGMDYDFIRNYMFKTNDGKKWSLNQFNDVGNYITKYPNRERVSLENTAAFFWTMRDINALKRTRTFIEKESANTIRVTKENFAYYCYVDAFKRAIKHVPYYFGNCNVFIDEPEFFKIKPCFIRQTCKQYNFLANYDSVSGLASNLDCNAAIDTYFRDLMGEHYVE